MKVLIGVDPHKGSHTAVRRRRLRLAAAAVLVALTIPILPVGVPVMSERSMVAHGLWDLREDYAEQIGWRPIHLGRLPAGATLATLVAA